MAHGLKLKKEEEDENSEEDTYRSLVGCLMYLTATRPDILFSISLLSRFLNCANEEHLMAAKRVVRYLKGTQEFGIRFCRAEDSRLVGWSDSDWAGSIDDMKSTSGYCFSIGSACFSWCSKKQESVAQSTAEAEFIAATAAANQAVWLRKLLKDLCLSEEGETLIKVDNMAAIAISLNPVFHGRTKHFKIKYFYLREVQMEGEVKLQHCRSEDQVADIFTKSFSAARFEALRSMLGLYPDH